MHMEKYTKSALGNMLKHYSREQSNPECRDNINHELTKLNYNLAPEREISDYQFIQQRLGEVKYLRRDDVNIIADWVITLPKDFNGNEEKFFSTAYKGMCSRYGEQNVVSAWVHQDEPQAMPHMHFCFMPIQRTIDKNNNEIEKLNAKAILNRQELKEIHPYMERYLERNHVPAHLMNGNTRDGNKAVKELKQEQAIKDFKAVETYRQVQKDVIEPVKPTLTLKGKVVPYDQYEHDVNVLNSRLIRQQKMIEKATEERDIYKNMAGQALNEKDKKEQELSELREQFWNKDFLRNQIQEVERVEREHVHTRDHDRQFTIDR